jgi:hypothetical protein
LDQVAQVFLTGAGAQVRRSFISPSRDGVCGRLERAKRERWVRTGEKAVLGGKGRGEAEWKEGSG